MLALQISSMKQFMNHLLVADTFESFLLEEAVIGTACTFHIDGHVNQEFFQGDEDEQEKDSYEFRPWSKVKGLCFDLIKGKRTPVLPICTAFNAPQGGRPAGKRELRRGILRSKGPGAEHTL